MNNISKFDSYRKVLTWFAALTLSALAAGCGGGGGGQDPILGTGGGAVITGTAPTVTIVSPLPNATAVPINTKIITAAFTKAMDPATLTTASFTLACPVGTAQTGTVGYAASGNVATLTLAANLPANATCTATITTAARDAGGIPLAAPFTWTFTTGAVPDTTAPTVTGTTNANGATNVAVNTKAGATFSEVMDPTTISATTFTLAQGATAVAGTVTYAGVNAVFTPASTLAANTTYTATITTGAKDVAGNALASNFVWSWTTGAAPDTTAPTVTGTAHFNGQTNVPINTQGSVTFSEAMDPLTINTANVRLQETVSSVAVPMTLSYTGVTATLIPLSNLKPNTNYTVTAVAGASGVKDLAGNPMANTFQVGWTTGAAPDTTAPTVTGTTHVNGQTNVAINTKASATFSEAMDPLTINTANVRLQETVSSVAVPMTLSYTGVTATLIPLSNLKPNTNYTVTVTTGVKDLAGNPMANTFQVGWTTGAAPDTTAPTVTGTIHTNGQINVPINDKAGAAFSEAMDPLTITNLTMKLQETVSSAAVAGTVSYSGVSAVFTPLNSLKPNTNYTLTIVAGSGGVKDLAGNAMANTFQVAWTTAAVADTTAPTVTLVDPANLETGVSTNSGTSAVFSEWLDPLTVNTATFMLAGPTGTPVAGTVLMGTAFSNALFSPLSGLAANTTYTSTIKGGPNGIRDLAGNAMATDYVWSWTTSGVVDTPPIVFGPGPAGLGPDLGAAAPFASMSSGALTNSGISMITGDAVTTSTYSSVAGFHDSTGAASSIAESSVGCVAVGPCGTVTGRIYASDKISGIADGTALAIVTAARAAALNAFSGVGGISPAARPGGVDVTTHTQAVTGAPSADNLGGRTLAPGIYYAVAGGAATYQISGNDLTLDAGGNPNAVWVFQTADGVPGTLTVNGRAVLLTNGAKAKNVYWYVPGGATINTGSAMVGTMIADASITFGTAGNVVPTTLEGRALVMTAGATMATTTINVPPYP